MKLQSLIFYYLLKWQNQLIRYGWEPFYLEGAQFETFLKTQENVLRETLTDLGLVKRL